MIQVVVQPRKHDDNLINALGRYMGQLSQENFFGVLEISFQAGEIVLVRKQESFKPAVFLGVL